MSEVQVVVLNPTGKRRTTAVLPLAARPADLQGKTVGLVELGVWPMTGTFLQHYGELLEERCGVGEVVYVNLTTKSGFMPEETVKEMASKWEAVFVALGNSGNCASESVIEGIEFEKRGIPAAVFVTEWFMSLAERTRKGAGMPDVNVLATPHPFDTLSKEEVIAVADRLFDQALAAVTAGAVVSAARQPEPPHR